VARRRGSGRPADPGPGRRRRERHPDPDALHQPAERTEPGPVGQLGRLAGPGQCPYVSLRVGPGPVHRRPARIDAEAEQRGALIVQAGVAGPGGAAGGGDRVQRDVRGEVAAAVRDRCDPGAGPVAGQRPGDRPGGRLVPVVDRDRDAALDPADRGGPGVVPGPADLGPVAGFGQRPPAVQPGPVGRVRRRAERLAAVDVDQHQPGAVPGLLHHVERDVVQPLVGDQQPGHRRQVGDVADGADPGPGERADLDREQPQPAPVRPVRGGHRGQQLTAAGAHVDQVERVGPAERRVHPVQQRADGLGEQRRGVHRGAEVVGRRLAAGVEAARPVRGGRPRLPPQHRHPGRVGRARGGGDHSAFPRAWIYPDRDRYPNRGLDRP